MTAPVISGEELAVFHSSHFSSILTSHFSEHFLGPVEEEEAAQDYESDGLGYYADGIKRNLTDVQIAIFRHSEIETLLRARRHAEENKSDEDDQLDTPTPDFIGPKDGRELKNPEQGAQATAEHTLEEGELDDGELPDSSVLTKMPPPYISKTARKKAKKAQKAQVAKAKGFFKQNIKPDLRKRTWDKVDTGLGSLDYEEEGISSASMHNPSQRRRISYDED